MTPKPIARFENKVRLLFTDIDDTLTSEGRLTARAYGALEKLSESGVLVVPVTGRPAGWCDMIARFWPVEAVIGENGAFYFSYDRKKKKMLRKFFSKPKDQARLDPLREKILKAVPGSALSADQFSRISDLAIDFCEDVRPLSKAKVQKIAEIFRQAGAQARVSSIHVNGWFGDFDKGSTALRFVHSHLGWNREQALRKAAFIGDSPNDEPLWKLFPHSFAVRNVERFLPELKHPPAYIARGEGGRGFEELVQVMIRNNCR